MDNISEHLLEVSKYEGAGYRPLIDYDRWRVAVLRFCDDLLPERIDRMQRHNETDEVFVLLEGRCILFLGEGSDAVTSIAAVDMEPLKLYNVKRGAWHSHTLSRDASVLIVENRDTTVENSPKVSLTEEQRRRIIKLANELWHI